MAIDYSAIFSTGLTYEEFKDSMTRNREQLQKNEDELKLAADDVAFFRARPKPLKLVVIAEDWCSDVIAELPILGKLAEASGKLDVRIFDKTTYPEIMATHLNQGKFESVPVFILLDDRFQERAVFTERPASVTERRITERVAIYAANPEFGSPTASAADLPDDVRARLQVFTTKQRADMQPFVVSEVVRELRTLASTIPA